MDAPTIHEPCDGLNDRRYHGLVPFILQAVHQFTQLRSYRVKLRVAEFVVPNHGTRNRMHVQNVSLVPGALDLFRVNLNHVSLLGSPRPLENHASTCLLGGTGLISTNSVLIVPDALLNVSVT